MNKRLLISENKLSVGQKLYSLSHGEMEIMVIEPKLEYPLTCRDNSGRKESFTMTGKLYIGDENLNLFMENPLEYTNERLVLVNFSGTTWEKRVFIKDLRDGSILCWDSAESLEKAKYAITTCVWHSGKWKELEEEKEEEKLVHLTFEQISKGEGKGVSAHLLRIKE